MFNWLFFWRTKAPKSLLNPALKGIATAEKGVEKTLSEIKAAESMLTRANRRQEFLQLANGAHQEMASAAQKYDDLRQQFADVI